MAGRPRTVSDEDLINATLRLMSRLGPVKLTLAEVAKEAGVTAATLVQRFGSKRALMLKICRRRGGIRRRLLRHGADRAPGVPAGRADRRRHRR